MSSIYKLSICGIRSFSDESHETIQFNGPLTLIVGTNGSGKTTIIECLKYATTNELPPNSKNGASFINDPNLHGSNETKAQIKLAFRSTKRINMILSKSLMAVKNLKTNSISFKTKENQLMSIKGSEKQTISSKIADIERMIPHYLGISKTILNYVVFCHQDDNLWPISESSVLKKKFDDIFDSTKFIKILENLKSTTKDLNAEIKLINNNVSHLKNDKLKYNNKLALINQLEDQIEKNNELMCDLNAQIVKNNENINYLYNSNQDYEKIIVKLESLENDKRNLMKNIDSIKSTTKIINKPNEQLQDDLNNFANILADQMKKCDVLNEEITTESNNLTSLQNTLNNLLLTFGNLNGLVEKFNENTDKKNTLINKFKAELDVENLDEFDSKVKNVLTDLKRAFEEKESMHNLAIDEITKKLDDVKFAFNKESQHKSYMLEDLKKLKNKVTELDSRLRIINSSQFKLENLRTDLGRLNTDFETFKKVNKLQLINDQINDKISLSSANESKLEENQDKLLLLRKTKDINSKIRLLSQLNLKLNEENEILLQQMLSLEDFSSLQFHEVVEKNTHLLTKYEHEYNTSKQSYESIKLDLSSEKNRISNLEDIIANDKKSYDALSNSFNALKEEFKLIFNDSLTIESFAEMYEHLKEKYTEDFEKQNDLEVMIKFNERAIKTSESKHNCLLCSRKFEDVEISPFQMRLKKFNESCKLKTDPAKLNERKLILEKMSKFNLEMFVNLKDNVILFNQRKIDQLQTNVKELESQAELAEITFNQTSEKYENLKAMQYSINSYKDKIEQINKNNEEISSLKSSIKSFDFTLTIEELEDENSEILKTLKAIRKELEMLRIDKDLLVSEENKYINDINKLKIEIQELEIKSSDKRNIEKLISEHNEQIKSMNTSISNTEQKIADLSSQLDGISESLSDSTKSKEVELNQITEKMNFYSNINQNFLKINEELEEFNNGHIKEKFDKCSDNINNLKSNIDSKKSLINSKRAELKELEPLVLDSTNQERNIRSNLSLNSLTDELIAINDEIEKLDSSKAYVEREKYLQKSKELQNLHNKYQKEISMKLGETSQLEKQINDLNYEIDTDYKDVNLKYNYEFAKLQTKLALITDLTTLYRITDNSIMEFHQIKMQKINNILDELWKKTYTGNDVETIKIKADPIASKSKNLTASNNRSYNYRVVMIKNGTELDMRGRCSAGQKVLASIIIRIALAECFCLNFGMITLDEPTTNLDDENIESLARALHSIIQDRRSQKNFQLIIITHDEKFLRYMNAVDFADHYYKVMRDERLNSTIRKVNISTVTE